MLAQFPGQDEPSISEDITQLPSASKSKTPSPTQKQTFANDDALISEGSSYQSDLVENSSSFHSPQLR